MTTEEMLARIEELEAENRRLKNEHGRSSRVISDDIAKDFPWANIPAYSENFIRPISKAIRFKCFPPETKPRKYTRHGKTYQKDKEFIKQITNMNDDEWERYCNILRDVLKSIEPHVWSEGNDETRSH